jgi:hypothetical protein
MAAKDVCVVLVHGAWADGSSWARVITALTAEGVKVAAAPLMLTSIAEMWQRSTAASTGRKVQS